MTLSNTIKFLGATLVVISMSINPTSADQTEPIGAAKQLIEHFQMSQVMHEGPWFAVGYVSPEHLSGLQLPERYRGRDRAVTSSILGVVTRRDFSALHRLQTDETWHFYSGDPLDMLLLYPDGHGEKVRLGSDVLKGERPQFTVPRDVWQGSISAGDRPDAYSFAANQLAPAFEYADFEIGYRDELQARYPNFAREIALLTRDAFKTRPEGVRDPSPTLPSTPSSVEPGASTDPLNSWRQVAPVAIAPGIQVRELVGRTATHKSSSYSVTHFTIGRGRTSATTHTRVAEETLIVLKGKGWLARGSQSEPIGPGSVLVIAPRLPRSIAADSIEDLEVVVVSSPAFEPRDSVRGSP